jgi:hypothetical protein
MLGVYILWRPICGDNSRSPYLSPAHVMEDDIYHMIYRVGTGTNPKGRIYAYQTISGQGLFVSFPKRLPRNL